MDLYRTNPNLFIEKANILKALAHPQRLCIVKMLCIKDQVTVTDMQECLEEAQSTVSQHISRLKSAGIIAGRREGTKIFYSIRDVKTRELIRALINDIFFTETANDIM